MPLNSDKPVHANWFLVSKREYIGKYDNHKLQTNPQDRDEETQHLSSKKTSERQLSKATNFLFLVKMIAKLERI